MLELPQGLTILALVLPILPLQHLVLAPIPLQNGLGFEQQVAPEMVLLGFGRRQR